MTDIINIMNGLDAAQKTAVGMDTIEISAGALQLLPGYLKKKQYEHVMLVVDDKTYAAAGKEAEAGLKQANINVTVTFITPNEAGDVVADERSVVELLLAIQQSRPQVVIAVGSGTIHDIVRYSAFTVELPFISVPTAPSVDGFNSKGAPLIIRGYKQTIIAIGPDAVFADLSILTKAPQALIAAGVGDIIGKYTSLFDWKFGHLTNDEPYSELAAQITEHALEKCIQAISLIANREDEGIAKLTSALIESGIAMLLFGKSHPASGAEHHLSHYWEMEYIQQGKKQLLHGAKVGVSCIEIAGLYHGLASQDYGLKVNIRASIRENWTEIKRLIFSIPAPSELALLLASVGGPTTIEELGIHKQLLNDSLHKAHLIRPERYTLLHAYNTEITVK